MIAITTAHDVLVRARALIAEPRQWTQGAMARNMAGDETSPAAPAASCFCTIGALERARHEIRRNHGTEPGPVLITGAARALRRALRAHNHDDDVSIVTFNDGPETTHADVLEIFDAAIAAEAARP